MPRQVHVLTTLLTACLALSGCTEEETAGTGGLVDAAGTADTAAGLDALADNGPGGEDGQADAPSDTQAVDAASVDSEGGDASCTVGAATAPGMVATERGLVQGTQVSGQWEWKGIPYAAPPLGALRWQDPQPAGCWAGVRDATTFGEKCLQKDTATGAPEGSEDCLTLNIFAPPVPPSKPLPVLVFIHGGGHIQGSASETIAGGKALYNGQHLALAETAIVVTIQYRLGVFGWLSLPELTAEQGRKSGNQGMRDQLAALGWVQRNIGAFGGDPSRVLLFGESAGAVDVCALMAVPSAKGLFSAALIESGGCTQPTQDSVQALLADKVGQGSCAKTADRLGCLRGMDAASLMSEMPGSIGLGSATFLSTAIKYGPVVDGDLLPQSPIDALAAGNVQPVPFVVGCNAEEEAKTLVVNVTTDAELQAALAVLAGTLGADAVAKVQAMYAASKYPTPQHAVVAAYSDVRFVCPSRVIARSAAKSQKFPVWRYFFSRQAPGLKGPVPASHGIELLYVFGTLVDIPGYKPAQADLAVSAAMMGHWARLARLGTPNDAGGSAWPAYTTSGDATLEFGNVPTAKDGVRTAECDLWGTLIPGY